MTNYQSEKSKTNHFITQIFNDKLSAEKAYEAAIQRGYKPEEINVFMSEKTRKQYYDSMLIKENTSSSKAVQGGSLGGIIGGTIMGTLGAIAAIGTVLAFPELEILIAGPLVGGLAGVGAGGISGGLIGAFVGWGVSEEKARFYGVGIQSGSIILGVYERDALLLENEWKTTVVPFTQVV